MNAQGFCQHCDRYYASQMDVSLHSQHNANDERVVVSLTELRRLYNIERIYNSRNAVIGQQEAALHDIGSRRRQEAWMAELRTFQLLEQIKTLEDLITELTHKLEQYDTIIDMLNLRVKNQERKYNRLLLKHTTLMKDE